MDSRCSPAGCWTPYTPTATSTSSRTTTSSRSFTTLTRTSASESSTTTPTTRAPATTTTPIVPEPHSTATLIAYGVLGAFLVLFICLLLAGLFFCLRSRLRTDVEQRDDEPLELHMMSGADNSHDEHAGGSGDHPVGRNAMELPRRLESIFLSDSAGNPVRPSSSGGNTTTTAWPTIPARAGASKRPDNLAVPSPAATRPPSSSAGNSAVTEWPTVFADGIGGTTWSNRGQEITRLREHEHFSIVVPGEPNHDGQAQSSGPSRKGKERAAPNPRPSSSVGGQGLDNPAPMITWI